MQFLKFVTPFEHAKTKMHRLYYLLIAILSEKLLPKLRVSQHEIVVPHTLMILPAETLKNTLSIVLYIHWPLECILQLSSSRLGYESGVNGGGI